MNLKEWLVYIEFCYHKEIDFGLDRIKQVANALGLLNDLPYTVIVGGTNGKGTTVAFLESAFLLNGYKIGTYTSPHLIKYNERIKISGVEVADEVLCESLAVIEEKRKQLDVNLTFFEFSTLSAIWIFKKMQVDIMILEVGMGGRLDAVNCVEPDLSIVTSVSIDHTDWLGDTIEKIGFEKAGIARKNKPFVYGADNIPDSVLNYLKEINAEFYFIHKDFRYEMRKDAWKWQDLNSNFMIDDIPIPHIPVQNVATSLKAIKLMDKFNLSLDSIKKAANFVRVSGRMQIIYYNNIKHILDVAHNQESARFLRKQLEEQEADKLKSKSKIIAVFSMLMDKDIQSVIVELIDLIDYWYVSGLNVRNRATDPEYIGNLTMQLVNKPVFIDENITMSHENALKKANPGDTIVVFGSFYVVGDILKKLDHTYDI